MSHSPLYCSKEKYMRSFRILLVVLSLLFPNLLLGQSTSASITGLVDDPAKALIPGASITAINTQTGEKASTTTNKEGQYVLPGLNPGTYRIEVDKQGFKGIIEAGLTLHVQDVVQINFHMAIGSSSESITVSANQNNINTQDGTVSTVIDQSYIANMPLNGRSFQDLILLTPGIVTNSPQSSSTIGATGEFSVNGQRTESNYYTVDGVSANVGAGTATNMAGGAGASGSLPGSTALGTTQGLVSVDSLQEFRVQSSTYSAEYGRNPGGQFAFDTKSGTNQARGSLFEYLRNGYFDAPDWFNDYFAIPYPPIHQDDFGGTVGGPFLIPHVYNPKGKSFFFLSYEGLRLISPQAASINYVPDSTLRASAPSVLQPPLNSFPVQNGPDFGGGVAEFIGSWSNPSSINSTSVRLDHAVNDKTKVFFRFSDTGSYATNRPSGPDDFTGNPSDPETTNYTLRTYTAGENTAFTSRLANELRLNYTSNEVSDVNVSDDFDGATPVNLQQAAGIQSSASADLFMFLGTSDSYNAEIIALDQQSAQKQWNLVETVSFVSGRHGLKFGVDYRRLTPTILLPTPEVGWVFFGESSIQGNSAFLAANSNGPTYPLFTNFSLFAQDEWRVSTRLNLSVGLRWDVNPPPGVTQGVKPFTMVGLSDPNTATLAPYGTPLWHTSWFNFAPRLGVAYTARNSPGRETVFRGGGGVFFDTGQQLGSLDSNLGPGSQSSTGELVGPYPLLPPIPPVVRPTPPYIGEQLGNVTGYYPNLQLPYTLQWNVSAQQALGQMQSVTVSYVGSHASRLLVENIVQAPSNPVVTYYNYIQNRNTADYNSLQAQFQRRLSAGLTAIGSYTWSHCQDYGSSNFSFGYQRGNCNFDVRHNFAAALSYNVSFGDRNAFASSVLSHWGLDDRFTARTAFPVTLTGNQLLQPNGQFYDAGLNLVPGQPIYLYGANCAGVLQGLGYLQSGQGCPGGRAINPNAFVDVESGLGDAPRNFARGFDAVQMDLAARREFPVNERFKLLFRTEAFNVFNHPNFGNVNGSFGQSTFGQATATLAHSLGVLSPLYQIGGARSMQFSLRFMF
jgi:hypothetical protein